MKKLKLTRAETLALSALLTALEGVQLQISMSIQAHDVVTMAIVTLVAAGLPALSPGAILAGLPPHVTAAITAALGGLVVLIQSFSIAGAWHTIVGVVVIVISALIVGPTAMAVPTVPVPPAKP